MLQSFMAMIIVTVLWVLIAFGLSFGPSIGGIRSEERRVGKEFSTGWSRFR